jgi:taurine dioxygenase
MQSPQIIVSGKSCGAEVTGVDLTEPGSFAISALQQAMKEHLVVVVRGKALSSSQLLALGEFLGPLEPQGISVLATQNAELRRAHLVVSNQMPLERPTGSLGAGADIWQSDLSYRTRPCSIAILHTHEVPSGSRVSFVNQYQAYETLPAELKARIQGRMLLHDESLDGNGNLRSDFAAVSDPREATGAQHGIARTPIPGARHCISVDGAMPGSSACRWRKASCCSTSYGRMQRSQRWRGRTIGRPVTP